MADKPYYPNKPIASTKVLAKTLGVNHALLLRIAKDTSNSYTTFTIDSKGKDRIVHEPKIQLKYIQKKINKEILSKTFFPSYLMGGISDPTSKRDYLENSKRHLRKSSLINLDIENFYHSIKREHVVKVFKHLFKFSDSVSETLSDLVTLKEEVPQGACTSSYIANLIFFNSEYAIVSKFRSNGLSYSRLLDDITISSEKILTSAQKNWAISEVAGMVTNYDLKLKNSKTRVEDRHNPHSRYEVTGAWVKFGEPKLRKKERNKIRHEVYICEALYQQDPTTEEYHKRWNKTSGKVAKLTRFSHKREAEKLRERLSCILPLYNDSHAKTLTTKVNQLVRRKKKNKLPLDNEGVSKQILRLYYNLGILSRTHPHISKPLKVLLRIEFPSAIKNQLY